MLSSHHWQTNDKLEWFGMVVRTWFWWIPWFIAGSVCTVWFVTLSQDEVVFFARWFFATSIFRLRLRDRSAEASQGQKFQTFFQKHPDCGSTHNNFAREVDACGLEQTSWWGALTQHGFQSHFVIRNHCWHSFCHHLLQSEQKIGKVIGWINLRTAWNRCKQASNLPKQA